MGRPVGGVADFLKGLGFPRLAAIFGVAGLVGVGFLFLMLRASSQPMGLLYTDLDLADSAQIAEQLRQSNTPFRQSADGATVYVPENEVLRLRMQFAQEGLPAGGVVGYEIFDNPDPMGATSFLQNVNRLRALEGELARTIASLDAVRRARVHLVIPERNLFARDQVEPSASITVDAARGTLNSRQVQAIQYLAASAVEGLAPDRVSIIDGAGALLASGNGSGEGALAGSQEEQRIQMENRVRDQVEAILAGVVGRDAVRVTVNAEMDFNRTVTESEVYDPDAQVVVSTTTIEENAREVDPKSDGGVSVANELPDAQEADTPERRERTNTSSRSEEVTNFANSRTTRTEVVEGGRLERLSVAVVVDGLRETAEDGTATWTPRSQDEMQEITALVRTAMGFSEDRGDQLEVRNLRFDRDDFADVAAEEPGIFDLDKADIVRLAELAALALIALILALMVFRPLMKRLFDTASAASPKALASEKTPQLAGPDQQSAEGAANYNYAVTGGQGQYAAGALPSPEDAESGIDVAQVQGQVKESAIKKVGEIVSAHPDESLSILRSWLHQTP